MGVIAAYRRVLRNGPLARLLFGEFVSSIGDWLYLVALLVLIWNEARRPARAGHRSARRASCRTSCCRCRPASSPTASTGAWSCSSPTSRADVIMLLIAAASFARRAGLVIVALAILATCFSAFFSPTIGAYLPSLTRDESELGPANSAWSSLDNLAFFIGPAFAALLLGHRAACPSPSCSTRSRSASSRVVLWRLPSGTRRSRSQPRHRTDRATATRRSCSSAGIPRARCGRCCDRCPGLGTHQHRRRLRLRRPGRHHRHPRRRRLPGRRGRHGPAQLGDRHRRHRRRGRRRRARAAAAARSAAARRRDRARASALRCLGSSATSRSRWSRWRLPRPARCSSRSWPRRSSSASCPTRSAAERSASWRPSSVTAYAAGLVPGARARRRPARRPCSWACGVGHGRRRA